MCGNPICGHGRKYYQIRGIVVPGAPTYTGLMEKSYDILFAGQLVDGHDEAAVRASLGALFKASGETLEKLFSGQPQLIKRGVDKATAAKYRNAMHSAGALALIKVSSEQTPSQAATADSQSAAAGKPQTMAERIAALAGDSPPQSAAPATTPDIPEPGARQASTGAPTPADDSGLSLAPAGDDVLREDERETMEPVTVDTSSMEVDVSGADIPSIPRFEEIPPAPDTSALSLGEIGEDIPNLPSTLEPLDIDTSAIDLAPEGTDFSDCIPTPVAIVEPDISGVELAPEGSELLEEQYQHKHAAAPPNVDHITLAEEGPGGA